MQRIFMSLYSLFACILTMTSLMAIAPQDKQDAKNDLRILDLLPNLFCPLAVEPGVPGDFIALSPNGILDAYDWIYWGPKNVLEAYFENPNSLKVPLIRVKLMENVYQTGPNSFNKEFMQFLKGLKKDESTEFTSTKTRWGNYPVVAIKCILNHQLFISAWVGLNNSEAGWTLLFNLVHPLKKGHPNEKDIQLWENLLKKTLPLKDGDFFKACGQDLQEGYTIVNNNGSKLKMLAEKRLSDGMLQVVVIPESSNIEFHYEDMMEGRMGAEWKYGEPIVKVYGDIIVKNKTVETVINCATSIFYKTVSEFSFNKEEENTPLIFQKIFDKGE